MEEKNLFFKITLLFILIVLISSSQVTKVAKQNVFLSRKKRYLMFPMRSNFVITFSMTKPLLRPQPRGYNLILECDVPFTLPSDTRIFKGIKRNHYIQRRAVLSQLENALDSNGLNGDACLKRLICETQVLEDTGVRSFVKEILSAVFMERQTSQIDSDARYQNACHSSTFSECAIPLLDYILGSLYST